ncbi:AIM24 family protein [Saxibacter everestensis]|uniref:AIM24 family protein n=1 Tax=Saxibacter everestensis TaxID=2909229 RepID=A0ABY8QYJ6_9MICO|nr:AIM24 family protein [Brevibacteriaceae bacterium ZFBP1038]
MRSELFNSANQEAQTTQRWTLQSSKMLRTALGDDVISTKGAMVAYQGNIAFNHEGSGSVGKFMKKVLTSEDAPMMRVSGQGEVFFARTSSNIFMVQLEGDAITVNSSNLLAMDASIEWDIKRVQGAGIVTGGLFNLTLQGNGMVAVSCDGDPLLLDCSQQPTFVDPNAVVCWSANLVPGVHNSMNMKSMLRGGSGESFQLAFHGPGFVVVQPSEGYPTPTA